MMTELQQRLRLAANKKELVLLIDSLAGLTFSQFKTQGLPDTKDSWLKSPITSLNHEAKPLLDVHRANLSQVDTSRLEGMFEQNILVCCGLNWDYEWAEVAVRKTGWLQQLLIQKQNFIVRHPNNSSSIHINSWEDRRIIYEFHHEP